MYSESGTPHATCLEMHKTINREPAMSKYMANEMCFILLRTNSTLLPTVSIPFPGDEDGVVA